MTTFFGKIKFKFIKQIYNKNERLFQNSYFQFDKQIRENLNKIILDKKHVIPLIAIKIFDERGKSSEEAIISNNYHNIWNLTKNSNNNSSFTFNQLTRIIITPINITDS
jgi:hypothetical protein